MKQLHPSAAICRSSSVLVTPKPVFENKPASWDSCRSVFIFETHKQCLEIVLHLDIRQVIDCNTLVRIENIPDVYLIQGFRNSV